MLYGLNIEYEQSQFVLPADRMTPASTKAATATREMLQKWNSQHNHPDVTSHRASSPMMFPLSSVDFNSDEDAEITGLRLDPTFSVRRELPKWQQVALGVGMLGVFWASCLFSDHQI